MPGTQSSSVLLDFMRSKNINLPEEGWPLKVRLVRGGGEKSDLLFFLFSYHIMPQCFAS